MNFDETIDFDQTLRGLVPGQRLGGRYELVRSLGQGGMGVVWLARDTELRGDEVAVKVLPEAVARDEDAIDDLIEEARVAQRLAHPGIMRLNHLDRTNQGLPFLVMEYLAGPTLKDVFRARRKNRTSDTGPLLSEEELRGLMGQLAPALDCAHAERVVHRDLKPGNLMFREPLEDPLAPIDFSRVQVKICDFGIARVLEDTRTYLTGVPSQGTLKYMSPEQIVGRGVGPASDLYSLGCLLYEAMSGFPPFMGSDPSYQHHHDIPEKLENVSDAIDQTIRKCLAKKARDRFATTGELLQLLREPVSVLASTPMHSATSRSSNHIETALGLDLEMVWIEAGSFMMGSPPSTEGRGTDEGPQHRVELDGYWLGKFEITQDQWRAVMGSNPSGFNGSGRLPVENVSWNEAMEFCRKLSQGTGRNYTLPTEAQWEYACRAGTRTPFSTGLTITTGQANFNGEYTYNGSRVGIFRKKTMEVGTFPSNAWGLHDMHGNVYEWCRDWYGKLYYESSPVRNPEGPGSGEYRVFRGGSWRGKPAYARAAARSWFAPVNCLDTLGFRVAQTSE